MRVRSYTTNELIMTGPLRFVISTEDMTIVMELSGQRPICPKYINAISVILHTRTYGMTAERTYPIHIRNTNM